MSIPSLSNDGLFYISYSQEEPSLKPSEKHVPQADVGSLKKRDIHSKEILQSGADHYHITHTHPRMFYETPEASEETAWKLRGLIYSLSRDILTFKQLLKNETCLKAQAILIDQIAQDKATLTYYDKCLQSVLNITLREHALELAKTRASTP